MDEEWADSCYTTKTKESGKYASICDIISTKDLMSIDFSDTAKCNYYMTEDKFAYGPIVMAIQVWLRKNRHICNFYTKFDLISKHDCIK